jgi:hypothetical protein
MFCSQCGASNADNAVICTQCGASLQAAVSFPQAAGVYVQNHLVFAILTTVLCLPAGIPAIVYASQVNEKLQAGDIAGAREASKNAQMWCWISVSAGVAIGVIWGMLAAIGVLSNLNR